MAHVFFCSRFWCTSEENDEEKLQIVKNCELIVGEEK